MFSLNEVILIVVAVSAVVGYAGFWLAEYRMISQMLNSLSEEELAKMIAKFEQEFESDNCENDDTLTQEVFNDRTYLYDAAGNFVSQGATAQEAATEYYRNHPESTNVVVECGEGKTYTITAGKINNNYLQTL